MQKLLLFLALKAVRSLSINPSDAQMLTPVSPPDRYLFFICRTDIKLLRTVVEALKKLIEIAVNLRTSGQYYPGSINEN
jgi:hypothetical protein